jgi:diacylglycerol kinase (ATP)
VALLVNPVAGRGRAFLATETVLGELHRAGMPCTVLRAATRDAAEQLVAGAVADGAAAVLAVGGDGAAHAVLQAVAGTGTALGLVPVGSGNDLAAELGVPADPQAAARAAITDLRDGRVTRLDAGRCGSRWWATVLCCGFDGAVTERAGRLRWLPGRRRYDVAVLVELARLRPRGLGLVVDGVTVLHADGPGSTLVAVGNTARYGGGSRICPDADPADGLLDVTVVGPLTRRDLLRTFPRLADGTHVRHPAVSQHRGAVVELTGSGLSAHADGEPVAPLPATAHCVPGALAVVGARPG